jgi:phage-related protein
MLPTIITMLAGMLPTLITSLIEGLVLIIQALAEMMPELIPTIIDAILGIIPILIDNLPLFIKAGWQLITGLLEGIIRSVPTLLSYIPKIISSLFNYFKQMPSMMLDIGKNLIKGLWNGIKNVKDWLFNKIGDFAGGILSKVKGIFGIHSPSKEFAIIGKYNVEGLEEGIEGESKNLDKTLDLNLGSSLDYVANMGLGKYNQAIGGGNANMSNPVYVNVEVQQDKFGNYTNTIKTFSNGAKNSYNYGAS